MIASAFANTFSNANAYSSSRARFAGAITGNEGTTPRILPLAGLAQEGRGAAVR